MDSFPCERRNIKTRTAKTYLEVHLTRYFKVMQSRLLKNSTQKYMVGNKPTIADFDSAHIANDYVLNDNNAFHKE